MFHENNYQARQAKKDYSSCLFDLISKYNEKLIATNIIVESIIENVAV